MQQNKRYSSGQFSGIFEAGIEPIIFSRWYNFAFNNEGRMHDFLRGTALSTTTHETLLQLPFILGESAAELRAPYSFDDEMERSLAEAMEDLLKIVHSRNQKILDKQNDDSSFALRNFSSRCLGWNTAIRLINYGEIWDGPSAEYWLSARGAGRAFFATLRDLYMRSALEDIKQKTKHSFICLTHLAAVNTIIQVKQEYLKHVNIRGLSYEKLDRIIGVSFWALIVGIIERFMDDCRRKSLPLNYNVLEPWFYGVTKPDVFTIVARNIDRLPFSPYELSSELLEKIQILLPHLTQNRKELPDPELVYDQIVIPLITEDDSVVFVVAAYFHGQAARFLTASGIQVVSENEPLDKLVANHAQLKDMLTSPKDAARWRSVLYDLRKDPMWPKISNENQVIAATLGQILEVASKRRIDQLKDFILNGANYPEQLSFLICLYLNDYFHGRTMKPILKMLDDRRRSADLSQLNDDYEAGKLYRFGVDDLPIIQTHVVGKTGQVFIDLKGFTRRTHRVKEVVIADFLEKEFYGPILKAAAKYAESGEEELRLNNLLGDAALFSGPVTSLVKLTRDIQEISLRYENKLSEIAPAVSLDRSAASIRQRLAEFGAKFKEEEEALKGQQREFEEKIEKKKAMSSEHILEQLKRSADHRLAKLRDELEGISEEDKAAKNKIIRQANFIKKLFQEIVAEAERLPSPQKEKYLRDKILQSEKSALNQINERLRSLQQEYNEMKASYESELENIKGFGLELGLFISYGAEPSIIELNEVRWGGVTVAIGEKINEAARGTARSMPVINRINAQLELARKRLGNQNLTLPFKVFIEESYELKLSPDLQIRLEQALSREEEGAAEEFKDILGEYVAQDIETAKSSSMERAKVLEMGSAIYNEGECLSHEALECFMQENIGQYMHIYKPFNVADLSEEIKKRFFFPRPLLNFVVSVEREKPFRNPFIFRFVGKMRFRGFERKDPTAVFELLRPRSPFYSLFVQHHLQALVEEATVNPSVQLSSLEGISL